MVFYIPPKRILRRRKIGDDKPTIADFPDEVLVLIVTDLPTLDVLRCRLLSTTFTPAATDVVKSRNKCLYLHPSASSLRAIPAICAHPVFSTSIEEVILLAKFPVDDLPFQYRLGHDVAVWPVLMPKSKTQAHSNKNTTDMLIAALAGLPNIAKLSCDDKIKFPGYNQISESALESFSKRNIGKGNKASFNTDVWVLGQLARVLQPRSFSVGASLPSSSYQAYNLAVPHYAGLKSLSLTLDIFRQDNLVKAGFDWEYYCGQVLEKASWECRLESLKLTCRITSQSRSFTRRLPNLANTGFMYRTFPYLRRFAIKAKFGDRPLLACQRPINFLGREIEYVDFFKRHTKLKIAVFDNIMLDATAGEGSNVLATTKAIVRTLQDAKVSVTYRLNRFKHHKCCGWDRTDSLFCRQYGCADYASWDGETLQTFTDFEALATEMDAPQHDDEEQQTSTWDFGKTSKVVVEK